MISKIFLLYNLPTFVVCKALISLLKVLIGLIQNWQLHNLQETKQMKSFKKRKNQSQHQSIIALNEYFNFAAICILKINPLMLFYRSLHYSNALEAGLLCPTQQTDNVTIKWTLQFRLSHEMHRRFFFIFIFLLNSNYNFFIFYFNLNHLFSLWV